MNPDALMNQDASALWDAELDADRFEADPEVDAMLVGGIDLHTHPAPAVYPARASIMDLAVDAASVGFRAVVCKSHHHSMQMDVLALRSVGLDDTGVEMYGGIVLNNSVGGLNPYAVEVALKMGGRIVWFPTIASTAHLAYIEAHKFAATGMSLRAEAPVTVLDENGHINAATREVLEVIAGEEAILNCGHLSAADISVLIPVALEAGVTRIVISHPGVIIGATSDDVAGWTRQGAFIELCLAEAFSRGKTIRPMDWIGPWWKAAGPSQIIFGSDLGMENNPLPVSAYRRLIRTLLGAGVSEDEIRASTAGNAAQLLYR